MDQKIQQHLNSLKIFNDQRRGWLLLSSVVVTVVLYLIFDWGQLKSNLVLWTITTIGFMLSVSWWYWTMKLIRELLKHRSDEAIILHEIVLHIRDVQNEIRILSNNRVDKDK
jgi:hypothetical protein